MSNYEVEVLEFTDFITIEAPLNQHRIVDTITQCIWCGGVVQEITDVCLNCERRQPLNWD